MFVDIAAMSFSHLAKYDCGDLPVLADISTSICERGCVERVSVGSLSVLSVLSFCNYAPTVFWLMLMLCSAPWYFVLAPAFCSFSIPALLVLSNRERYDHTGLPFR